MTDCARISLELTTAGGMERVAMFVLQAASTFKNRVAHPTTEGYRDLLFTVLIDGHVCEIQMHIKRMHELKNDDAHSKYKKFRDLTAK